jgi:S1-C subfamily serine protease
MARFGCAVACVLIVAILYFLVGWQSPKKQDNLAETTVYIQVGTAHGSGVIFDGGILTAAHVVGDAKEVTAWTKGGSKFVAEVMWINRTYDIAFLKFNAIPLVDGDNPGMARLNCDDEPSIGQHVMAIGNPGILEFIHSWGRVSAISADHSPYWKLAFISTVGIAPGNSGGPVFDEQGRIIGIVVGISVLTLGMFPAPAPFAYIVPSSAVCKLLARPRNN